MRITAVIIFLFLCNTAFAVADTLVAKPIYGKEVRNMVEILDQHHYSKILLNDSLSSVILDTYINDLDPSRTYFMQSDIESFEKYRTVIDDLARRADVSPAYSIFDVYRRRFQERQQYVMDSLIDKKFDFTKEEYYETDRKNAPWCKTKKEMNALWETIIKSQVLGDKLLRKPDSTIKKNLTSRYKYLGKTLTKINAEDVFGIYMNAITESYDPHTNYLTPSANNRFNESMSLSLEGIGAQLQSDGENVKVVDVISGGPADKSKKLVANDLIIGVGQNEKGEMVNVQGWRLDDVVKMIKGPKGTTVRLQIIPAKTGFKGGSQEIVLVRDKIKLEDMAAKMKVIPIKEKGKIKKLGVITLPEFYMDFEAYNRRDPNYRSTTRDVRKLIDDLNKEDVCGIVMDLRNNGGGSLTEAIELTGLFIKEGPIVQVKNTAAEVEVLPDPDKELFYDGPLVVLTNRGSASASEIFAAAIQDYRRGVIMGESTFGKGTVQMIVNLNRVLPNEKETPGSVKITYQKFYRINGSSTQLKGVTPDIILPSPLAPKQFGESASASALPWDEIRKADYKSTDQVNPKLITNLSQQVNERMKNDSIFKKFVKDIDKQKKYLADTKISLQESMRRKEMEEMKTDSLVSTRVSLKAKAAETDIDKLDDEYLREGLLTLAYMCGKKYTTLDGMVGKK